MNEIIFLGCGPSLGVPVVGCKCKVCLSEDKFNKRLRSAMLVKYQHKNILIDFGPDLRQQLLREKIDKVDAVILTHTHADHMHGIDDLKIFTYNNELTLYSDEFNLQAIKMLFSYMFDIKESKNNLINKRKLKIDPIILGSSKEICKLPISFVHLDHNLCHNIAIKFNNIMYANDFKRIPKESEKFFENLDLLIIDCLNYEGSKNHLGLKEVIEINDQYKPKKIILTNMNHDIDYKVIKTMLPNNIIPAYDGLKLSF